MSMSGRNATPTLTLELLANGSAYFAAPHLRTSQLFRERVEFTHRIHMTIWNAADTYLLAQGAAVARS
jgi:hypothetical protein